MNLYTEKQVKHLLVAILLGEPWTYEDQKIPIHDVGIERVAEQELRISMYLDGYKETSLTLPLDDPPVSQQTYEEAVLRTYAGHNTQKDKLTLGALGLAGESGEVVDAVKKWLFQGHQLDALGLLSEIGDVLWYLALMCSAFDWTLDDALKVNMEKLRRRYPNGFEASRSVNRQENEQEDPS